MNDHRDEASIWLERARSNLARAKVGQLFPEIMYEDLCFDAQQAAEKALKALFVVAGWQVPRSHDITRLLRKLAERYIIPEEVQKAAALSVYAVTTRYPGKWEPVTKEDWEQAVAVAEATVNWVERGLKAE